jgi:hypothetical protein
MGLKPSLLVIAACDRTPPGALLDAAGEQLWEGALIWTKARRSSARRRACGRTIGHRLLLESLARRIPLR